MKRMLAIGSVLALLLIMAYSFLQTEQVVLGERAVSDQPLTNANGQSEQLYDYVGKPTMLTFWATWCIPCSEEMPHVQSFYEQHGDDIHILAVNATDTEKSIEAVRTHVKQEGWTFPVFIDEKRQLRQIFGALTVPTTVFLQANGEIAHEVYGPIDEAYMESILAEL
ncbi:MAG: TlpA disulfide reductase family protein [Caryophanon sp.]|nr:TlpA disulfide reductase family protein [Caryophanon sp.]